MWRCEEKRKNSINRLWGVCVKSWCVFMWSRLQFDKAFSQNEARTEGQRLLKPGDAGVTLTLNYTKSPPPVHILVCAVIMPGCSVVTTALCWISRLPRQHSLVTSVYVSESLRRRWGNIQTRTKPRRSTITTTCGPDLSLTWTFTYK